MPVKPENKALYPKNWAMLSAQAKERAGWKCQHPGGCTARQYAVGHWLVQGVRLNFVEVIEPADSYSQSRQNAADLQYQLTGEETVPGMALVVIVLTTAHLDHDPANCEPGNLRVLCQRHHLQYDQQHHNATSYTTRMSKRKNLELPL